jgi:hypothetical protein
VEQARAEQAKVGQVKVDQRVSMDFQDMETIPVFLPQEDQVETIDFIQLYSLLF